MSDLLKDPRLNLIIISILVKRLGGEVLISQADIDTIAYGKIWERVDEQGLHIKLDPQQVPN